MLFERKRKRERVVDFKTLKLNLCVTLMGRKWKANY